MKTLTVTFAQCAYFRKAERQMQDGSTWKRTIGDKAVLLHNMALDLENLGNDKLHDLFNVVARCNKEEPCRGVSV